MKLKNIDFIKSTQQRHTKLTGERGFLDKDKVTLDAETDERRILRLDHLTHNRFEPFDLAKERIMGRNDLMPVNYLLQGYLSAYSICRIHIRNENGRNEGFGTGFLISPQLLITNHHVLENEASALKSYAEFNYQYQLNGLPTMSDSFILAPEVFFATNKDLDYTIVAVQPQAVGSGKNIAGYGYLQLSESTAKALVTENLSIIQHPSGGFKQIAIRENQLITSDPNSDFITYATDTTQGSSGAAVFNDQWQVVALHHSGVPKTDAAGNILCKDGSIWQIGMEEYLIDWLSNEGVRISAILKDLQNTHSAHPLVMELITLPPFLAENLLSNGLPDLPQIPPISHPNHTNTPSTKEQNTITFTLPLEITVKLGSLTTAPVVQKITPVSNIQPNLSDPTYEVKKSKQPDYSGRNGYDSNFLEHQDFCIELEDLTVNHLCNIAPLLNPTPENKYRLDYYNFSVVMHKQRRLCLFTAVNINGNQTVENIRESTPWILDPRMSDLYQTGPKVYVSNDLDRGHMVKRLDPVWGAFADLANDDTFHFTNSTPQHKNLNQKTWLSLENYIFNNAMLAGLKISVFTGPIFSDEDIPYRGILLPLQFWKVVAMVKKDGTPSVSGYMLKQPDEIDDFKTTEGISDDGYGQFKTYQVPLARISTLTGIPFDQYSEYDPMAGLDFNESLNLIEIIGEADIKL